MSTYSSLTFFSVTNFFFSRGFCVFPTRHLGDVHIQGAVRAEQKRQRDVLLYLLRPDAERREHIFELSHQPGASHSPSCQLVLQRIPRHLPEQERCEILLIFPISFLSMLLKPIRLD